MKLNEKRVLLDKIDAKISKLLNERFLVVEDIKKIKEEEQIPILDTNRETEVINKNIIYINDKYQNSFKEIYEVIMNTSKELQKDE